MYSGKSMKEAHEGLNLNEGHWNLVCNTLIETLRYINVGEKEILEVTELIMPLKKFIISK